MSDELFEDEGFRRHAFSLRADSLAGELMQVHDDISGILDGSIKNSRWNGFGASLCVYGMVLVNVGIERLILRMPRDRSHAQWVSDFKFFVQAQYMMTALGERIEKPASAGGKPRMTARYALSSKHPLCCSGCPGRNGFTNRAAAPGEWWVCSSCHRPTEGWFRGQGDAVLNKFTGGPLDAMVYTSSSLLDDPRLSNLILGYQFTPEILTSENTGAIARVWLYAAPQPGSVSQARSTETTTPINGRGTMTATEESTETAAAEPVAPVEPVNVSDLLTKRNALKLSRTPVSQAAGVTVAQLARIEKGGPRTTQAEADQVRAALVKLEAEAPIPAPPASTEAAAATEAAGNPA